MESLLEDESIENWLETAEQRDAFEEEIMKIVYGNSSHDDDEKSPIDEEETDMEKVRLRLRWVESKSTLFWFFLLFFSAEWCKLFIIRGGRGGFREHDIAIQYGASSNFLGTTNPKQHLREG